MLMLLIVRVGPILLLLPLLVLSLLLLFLLMLLVAVLALLIRLDFAVLHTKSSLCKDYTPANRNRAITRPVKIL